MKMENHILLGMAKNNQKFFSGFCLENESQLFGSYLQNTAFCFAGFSFGAQSLIEFALNSNERIDKIQLFSPAFFNDKDEKFKRMQLMFWSKNQHQYIDNFLQNCVYPSKVDLNPYFKNGSFEELKELLNYDWSEQKLLALKAKNIKVETFFGQDDKIIDSNHALDFFCNFSQSYMIKKVGHILQ